MAKQTHAKLPHFLKEALREKKEVLDPAQIRESILEGYQDALDGRTVPYRGDLRVLLKKVRD